MSFDPARAARVAVAVDDFVHDRDARDLRGDGLAVFVREVVERVEHRCVRLS